MAEQAHNPPPSPEVLGQRDNGSVQNSLHSATQDTSQQTSPSECPSTAPPVIHHQNLDQSDYGPGLYAVPTPHMMGMMPGFPPNSLIPLTFKVPTRTNTTTGTGGADQVLEARQQQGPQRPVIVRRFHFAFQLDLALIIKLAAVVFLFSQEGSRHRLFLLILFATFIYLYQTGALSPLMRWIRRVGAPPQPRPAIQPDQLHLRHADGNQLRPEGNPQADNQNLAPQNEQAPAAVLNENPPEAEIRNENQLWVVLKEIQMFVVGFITSLLPGFHHHND